MRIFRDPGCLNVKGAERAANRIDEAQLNGVENLRLYASKAQ